jgi:hypothetical protein
MTPVQISDERLMLHPSMASIQLIDFELTKIWVPHLKAAA